MRVVTVAKSFTRGVAYVSGRSYVMSEDCERQIGDMVAKSVPLDPYYKPYKGEDLSGKRLLTWRTGGAGDMMLLAPALRVLKRKYPSMHLTMASGCRAPLEQIPEIDDLIDMPFDSALLAGHDYHVTYQGIIEGESEQSKRYHATDLFLAHLHIDPSTVSAHDKRPRLVVTTLEKRWREQTLARLGLEKHTIVGVQAESTSPIRNYPREALKVVVDTLTKVEEYKVVIIGAAEHAPLYDYFKGDGVIDGTQYTLRQSIILAGAYSLIIAPDSLMVQVGGAYEIPTVGLYGPFSSRLRMAYHRYAIGLDPNTVCTPCCHHDYRPCVKGYPSPCFTQIGVRDIMEAIDYMVRKIYKKKLKCMEVACQQSA